MKYACHGVAVVEEVVEVVEVEEVVVLRWRRRHDAPARSVPIFERVPGCVSSSARFEHRVLTSRSLRVGASVI